MHHRRRSHGDDLFRLHHLDDYVASLGRHLRFRLNRILPPALALTMSLVEITAWLFYCAIAAYWMVTSSLLPHVRCAQSAHWERDFSRHIANDAGAVVHISDWCSNIAHLAGRPLLRHAILSDPQ